MNRIDIRQIHARDTWDIRHSVMWPNMPFDYVKLPQDEEGTHFGLYKNQELVSIVSLFFVDNKAQFRKLATKKHEQGQGIASKLLQHVFDFSKQNGSESIWCNARVKKATYYKRFGMKTTNKTFTKGGIEFVVMEKQF